MKRIAGLASALAMALCMVGCGGGAGDQTPVETFELEGMNAQQVIEYLDEQGVPIYTFVAYTEETDPNDLLGRPGEYTSKASFVDEREAEEFDEMNSYLSGMEGYEPDYLSYGGTVEVFASEDECAERLAYLESLSGTLFGNNEYMYQRQNVLLRVNYCLTPTQAQEYEAAFMGSDYVVDEIEGDGDE